MPLLSIGDLARHMVLQKGVYENKVQITTLSQEVTSGQKADLAQAVKGDTREVGAIANRMAQLDSWKSINASLAQRLQASQSALGALQAISEDQSASLIKAGFNALPTQIATTSADARTHLDAVIGLMNAQTAGRSLFSGVSTDQPTVIDAERLLGLALAEVQGSATPEAAFAALQDWLERPTGFDSQAYLGSDNLAPINAGGENTILAGVTGKDPTFKGLLKGLIMPALLEQGLFTGSLSQQREVLHSSGMELTSASEAVIHLQARIGISEAQLQSQRSRNEAEGAALKIGLAEITEVDVYEKASALEQAQTQLTLLHTLTARFQRLSLAEFLR